MTARMYDSTQHHIGYWGVQLRETCHHPERKTHYHENSSLDRTAYSSKRVPNSQEIRSQFAGHAKPVICVPITCIECPCRRRIAVWKRWHGVKSKVHTYTMHPEQQGGAFLTKMYSSCLVHHSAANSLGWLPHVARTIQVPKPVLSGGDSRGRILGCWQRGQTS